jgi:hypothetical protein
MKTAPKPYPSDVSEEEWALVAPYPVLLPEEAACKHGIKLAVVKLSEVKDGFALLPWRCLAKRIFA